MRALSLRRGLILAVITALAGAACAPGQSNGNSSTGAGKIGGSVNVLATWSGSEQDSFMAMIQPFETQTGVTVNYESTRDLNAVLNTGVQTGNPPELAGLPGPGQMFDFAKAGKLVQLDNVLDMSAMNDQYSSSWVKLGQYNGKTYSIFIKTSLKGLVFYDPKNFAAKNYQEPKTWNDLMTLQSTIKSSGTTPWCITLESGSASGWPGTDQIKEIVLSQSGINVYNDWWAGKHKWSSPEIKKAWQTWGQVIGTNDSNVFGGKQQMLATNFGDVGQPMFLNPPKCYMVNQGSFISDFFTKYPSAPKPITDFKFFSLPDVNPSNAGSHVVAGDLFAMFKSTPQARALIKYLTTPEAQAIWVKRGGAISPNKKVALSDYPDELSRSVGQIMTTTKIAAFDAGDLMPNAMQSAWWSAVLKFVNDQGQLDTILADLDKVQATAYTS